MEENTMPIGIKQYFVACYDCLHFLLLGENQKLILVELLKQLHLS